MGYTTDFEGEFRLSRPLTEAEHAYLTAFSVNRHMKRDIAALAWSPAPLWQAVKDTLGFIGEEGQYWVDSSGFCGQDHTPDILDYNEPPDGLPGLWCQWRPNGPGDALVWDGGEKFYDYVLWIQWLITNVLDKWGIVVNGDVSYQGEDRKDYGVIRIRDSQVVRHVKKTLQDLTPKTYTEEEFKRAIGEAFDRGVEVTLERRKDALSIGQHILDGKCLLETRAGRYAKLEALKAPSGDVVLHLQIL